MSIKDLIIIIVLINFITADNIDKTNLNCHNGKRTYKNVAVTGYYPDFTSEQPKDYLDLNGKKLKNVQDYLDNRTDYITASLDPLLKIPYGTTVCIPELNYYFTKHLNIQIRDSNDDMKNAKYTWIDICVRTESDSYDKIFNRNNITLIFF